MHLCTIRPCPWRISRQLQISRCHVRLLSRVSAARTSSINEQNVGYKRIGRKRLGKYNGQDKQREQNLQDLIFLDDLVATLEAHCDYNRGSVIRKIRQNVANAIIPFKRPSLDSANSENAETSYERGEDEVDTNDQSSTSARGPGSERKALARRVTVSIPWARKILGTKALARKILADIPLVREVSGDQALVRKVTVSIPWARKILGTKALARKILADIPLVREVSVDQAWVRKVTVTTYERRHGPHPRQWPADSVQNFEEGTKTRNTGFVRSVDPLEYKAAVIPITQSWKWTGAVPSTISTPWAPYVEDSTGDNYERLSNEIRAFEAYMRLSPAEEAAAQLVHSDITSVLRELLATKSLTLLGSRSTGLAAPTSDFNYRVDIDSPEQSSTEDSQELTPKAAKSTTSSILKRITRGLQESNDIATTELVFAPVPMIKCRHRATGLDIQFQTMSPSQASQQYTAAYLSELPSLRPLYILVRHFLEIRYLTAVSRGGLGPYTTLMMIVAALKHSRGEFPPDDLGGQLLHVLDFYGNANLYENGFSVDPPRTFKKIRESKRTPEEREALYSDLQLQGIEYLIKNSSPRRPYLLCLQDPANAYNDLGRAPYAIRYVQVLFKKMHASIKKALSQPGLTQRFEDWSLLAPMVRADYSLFEINRRNLERCNNPDAKLTPEDATEDTISALLERRLKIYKGEMEEDDLPFTPASPDLEPGLITKYGSEGWYPGEYIIKPHAKPKRSRRQMNNRAAKKVAKRRQKREMKKRIGGADVAKDEAPAAEETRDDEGEGTLLSKG